MKWKESREGKAWSTSSSWWKWKETNQWIQTKKKLRKVKKSFNNCSQTPRIKQQKWLMASSLQQEHETKRTLCRWSATHLGYHCLIQSIGLYLFFGFHINVYVWSLLHEYIFLSFSFTVALLQSRFLSEILLIHFYDLFNYFFFLFLK